MSECPESEVGSWYGVFFLLYSLVSASLSIPNSSTLSGEYR